MTDDQILELASQHFLCLDETYTDKNNKEWFTVTEDLLKFARIMYEEGYDDGCFKQLEGRDL